MESSAKQDPNSYDAQQAAWYQYYQQTPEAQAQHMAQWQAQASQYYGYDQGQQAWGANRGGGYAGAQGGASGGSYGAGPSGGASGGYGAGYGGYGGYGAHGGTGGDSGYQRRERAQPSATLWVGNLTPSVREEDIRRSFEPFGAIESIRMLDTRNCAFVTFNSVEASKNAHANTYGLKINGTEVKINWGRHTPSRQGDAPYGGGGYGASHGGRDGGYGGGGYHGGAGGGYGREGGGGYGRDSGYGGREDRRSDDAFVTPSPNIWIGHIDPNATEQDLKNIFERFGAIERVKLHPQKNCAFINFVDINSALAAKAEMNGYSFFGQSIKVNFGKPRDPSRPPYGGGGGGGYGGPSSQQGSYGHYDQRSTDRQAYSQAAGGVPSSQGATVPSMEARSASSSAPVAPTIPLTEPQNIGQEMKDIIDKLVEAFAQNPDLEAQTRANQQENPKFAFLFPGREGHEYFLWKRYGAPSTATSLLNIPSTRDASQVPSAPKALPPGAEPLSANEAEDLEGILRNLDPSKDKIKAGADFAATHADKGDAVALAISDYASNKISPNQQVLHIVYLVNEIFNVMLRAKVTGATPTDAPLFKLPAAFLPVLPRLMALAYNEDSKKILQALLGRWKDEGVFTEVEIEDLKADFETAEPKKRKREDDNEEDEDGASAKRKADAPADATATGGEAAEGAETAAEAVETAAEAAKSTDE